MSRTTIPTRRVRTHFGSQPHTDVPDFAAIVPLASCEEVDCDGCDECATSWWTPRTADLLHTVIELEIDMLLDESGLRDYHDGDFEADGFDTWWFEDLLPPVVRAKATPAWMARFIGCYIDLYERIEAGEVPYPRCTGEEMALHNILAAAKERLAEHDVEDTDDPDPIDGLLHVWAEVQNELPRTPSDYNIDLLSDILFEDHDVLMLFNANLDGIEHSAIGAGMGIVNLHYPDWFEAFRTEQPVPAVTAGFDRQGNWWSTECREVRQTEAAAEAGSSAAPSDSPIAVTATYVVTRQVTDARALLTFAYKDFSWPAIEDLDDLTDLTDDVYAMLDGGGVNPVEFLFGDQGSEPTWAGLEGAVQQALCQSAIGWVVSGGGAHEDIPGTSKVNDVLSVNIADVDDLEEHLANLGASMP